MKKVLSIAGSDCSGGAGIQADLKTFSAHGVYGMSVITSVVAENTVRVISYQDMTPAIITEQINAIFEDITPNAIKIGMLSCVPTMIAVTKSLQKWQPKNVVLDPVMFAKNGMALMEPSAIDTLIQQVLPLATLVTPNIPEAEKISGKTIRSTSDMEEACRLIYHTCACAVLLKGGHKDGDATDILFDGKQFYYYTSKRIETKNTHGTGCTFSAAIASQLALGLPLNLAVAEAKNYITLAIQHSLAIGSGHGPTHHFYDLYRNGLAEDKND
ncbi:bifunctional hydroxymethylpyrimidine kinase/phosphomethylpyrimidine kinase [Vagococcus intermedius]|uniref:Hydroxymethylpyrimidine/phosphomethylpyrimidine kinase n=1 Tax=Vagococcus intermedius TaxID=2991418 RepID=A0AAF0CT91_9ENTE|nr:bifunctional hydroxymethylpyrimidine kinase/phosphomethylpyrimidine kinase [Vagococcus intermedius]WEG72535.1 bifunctional hydroxymethylpyrimidine kinase/phosphomethylpyrimidine kinase [Vagococcus intermedius]WEG74623.1 bifunctional hydroxymethylpyrimidine kinase/phosphomethylpyrimidine kinase [Vagococcus intermedius]